MVPDSSLHRLVLVRRGDERGAERGVEERMSDAMRDYSSTYDSPGPRLIKVLPSSKGDTVIMAKEISVRCIFIEQSLRS